MLKKTPFQMVAMIAGGLILAIVANGFASRQRRLVLPGYYPDARIVPTRVAAPASRTASAPATTTVQSPAPGQPAMTVETSTIERPAGAAPATPIVASPNVDPYQTAGAAPSASPAPATTPAATTTQPAAPAADPLARFAPHPDKAYVEISGEDAVLLHSRGALFLDARRTSVYEAGHIAGSRTFSVWESDIDDKVNALYEQRSDPREQNQPIVIYCSGGACEDSHMLAQKLWGIQFNNIYVYKDGFPDWQQRGGAVRTGAQQ
ncbi:MAG TPA: rhodanese-like domain-containing protein [Thermoanaerobaculia bacterium]|nr:rhodanese-like domain-containing protein [Thermoanaerobaculia bacterium]